jgi:hypothetical protein
VKHRSAQAQADLMMIRARPGLVRVRGWSTRPADRKIVDDLRMHNPEWPQQQPRTNDCADEEACCDSVHHTTAVGCRANGMSNWLRHSQKPCSLHLSAMAIFRQLPTSERSTAGFRDMPFNTSELKYLLFILMQWNA